MVIGSLPFGRSAFGMGDAKLILLLGVLLGPRDVLVAVLLAFVAAGVVAGALLISRQRARGSYLPLGPFLAIGGIAAMLWGGEIWEWWVE
jgi:leader peptidase (prepilin peptidase)/N-methyltransferase